MVIYCIGVLLLSYDFLILKVKYFAYVTIAPPLSDFPVFQYIGLTPLRFRFSWLNYTTKSEKVNTFRSFFTL